MALVLRALGLGDLLTAVPALRGIRRALPHHEVVLAVPAALVPLVELTGAVDRVLPATGLAPLTWNRPPPDVAVNLHGRGPQSHELLQALRPRRLVAYACGDLAPDGPEFRADEHEVSRWCRLVDTVLSVPCPADDLVLSSPEQEPRVRRATVVHPGAAHPSRRWPPERYAAVAAELSRRGHHVVVTGSSSELHLATQVAALAGLPDAAVLAGRTSILELAALVADANLVVCGDTGTAHLATAFRTPSVVLFGPVSPALWGPPHRPEHVVLDRGAGRGDPFGQELDPALAAITVDDVLAALRDAVRP